MLTTEQKLLCALSHLGIFIGIPIVAPLVVLLFSNDEFIKCQAKEALAFQIGVGAIIVVGVILSILLVGIPILIVSGLALVVFPIIATIKIADGVDYSYPITGRFVRKNF